MKTIERFYKTVSVRETDDGIAILLDERPVRTPGRSALVLANRQIGEAVAEEWESQTKVVDPVSMPLTRLANSSIDQVAPDQEKIVDHLVQYAGSDLTCYRADDPEALQQAQAAVWDPLLDWFHEATGARLLPTAGIMPLTQSEEALAAVRTAIDQLSVQILTGLHVATTSAGSLVIAYAGVRERVSPEEAWAAATVDERWQREKWGADTEALDREAKLQSDFATALRFAAFHQDIG